MRAKVQYFILVLGVCITSLARANDFDISIKTVELTGELSAANINVIYADSLGFLWLGTTTGLYRWDGVKALKIYKDSGLEHVTAISQSPTGEFWVGFKDGSLAFTSQQKLISFKPDGYSNDTASVSNILINKNGNVWWSTHGSGVYCYSNHTIFSFNEDKGLNDNYVYEIAYGNDNRVWAATDNGVSVFYLDTLNNTLVPEVFTADLPDLIVQTIVRDHEGFMWFGFHQEGIGYYNPQTKRFYKIKDVNGRHLSKVSSLSMQNLDVWIVDSQYGLFYSKHPHSDTMVAVRFKDKSINEGIRAVVSDNYGNIWILTKKNLYISNGGTIKIVDLVTDKDHNMLHSINITDYQSYWLTINKNLVKLDENGFKPYLENILDFSTIFTSSIIDPLGRIWSGTLGQGILVYEPKSGKKKFITSKQGLINDNILSMAIADNTIWVATLGGASAISLDEYAETININNFNKENGLSSNFIYSVFADSKGSVWFGTDGNGIIKLENNIFYTYDESHGINDKIIYSIIEDKTGTIWFSTSSGLIYRYEGSDFVKHTPGHGYVGNIIYSMATDGDFLYILTEKGLNVYNYLTEDFVCFNKEVGINRIGSDLNSVCKGYQLISFATHNKVIQIDLDLINRISLQPASSIDKITVNLKPVNTDKYQKFSFNENRFIFEYSGNWPLAPEKLRYMVKLDGYDHNWKSTFDRSAIYPNLPPGDYTFNVKAYLNNPNQNNISSSYYFTISPPYYLTWWFIMSLILCALLAIFWFIKRREQNLKKREAQKLEQLEFEFQTLKNQINPHFLFNSFSTLISIIEDNQEDAVEYTEALSAFFRNILEVKDELLISLEEELKMMKNYSLIHQKRLGNIFKLEVNLDEEIMLTKIPPLTLQLLTENVLKHNVIAKGKSLLVTVKNNNKWIIVENNVRLKKQTEKSTGIGLRNIQERYKLISKTEIIIESNSEKFRIHLPIIK